MRYLPIICLLLLTACKSTIPSETITNTVISDLKAHKEAIRFLEKQTTNECKTEAFITGLNALKQQTESIVGQVKGINQACQSEKQEIINRIYTRNCIIIIFLILLIISFYFHIKK